MKSNHDRVGSEMLDLIQRPRRNRKNEVLRGIVRETTLSADRFILPLFIHDLSSNQPIASMPGRERLSPEGLLREAEGALHDGVKAVVLFPALPESLKSSSGEGAYDSRGLVPRSIQSLKNGFRNSSSSPTSRSTLIPPTDTTASWRPMVAS